ncbi:MAG: hypothetical protein ACR2HP_00745 [Ilumatobacteraceae bacterium]
MREQARADAWTGVGWLSTRWLRRRWPAMIPIALIVAAGTTGTAIALSTAERTADAYDDYRRRSEVGDVVINPDTNTAQIDEVIRTLPGVERVTMDPYFVTTLDDGRPRPRAEVGYVGGSEIIVHGSSDGRYTEMDRPAVQSGRMPANAIEAAITVDTAVSQGLGIGDTAGSPSGSHV